jgi:hypothetical protein
VNVAESPEAWARIANKSKSAAEPTCAATR